MRAAAVDYRTRVRFSWEGTAGASESRAVLDGRVLVRNLAKNPMCSFQNYVTPNNTQLNTVSRNQPVPAPHPLGISTCASSELLISNNDILSMYNVDGRLNTDSFTKWGSAWVWSEIDCVSRIRESSPVTVPANTWTLVKGIVQPGQYFTLYVNRSGGGSEVGMKAYVTGVTSVLSPDIPPCFSGASKDIDRIRIADWYAGLTDDQRLDSIAGLPVMQVAAPTTRLPLPPVGTTVIFVGRYQYSADLTSGRQMTIAADPQYGYITGVQPSWLTVLPASQRGIEGSLVWSWMIISSSSAGNLGLGSHATSGSYSPWIGPMRAVTYNAALPAEQIMRVVRCLAQQLPL